MGSLQFNSLANPGEVGAPETRLRIRESVDSIEMLEDSQRQAIMVAKIANLDDKGEHELQSNSP
jgi:hypothetical protein